MTTKEQVKPVWKCQVKGCDYTAPPTVGGYRKLSGHQLAHAGVPKEKRGFSLIDEKTGEVLAQNLSEATAKGFIVAKAPEPPTSPVPEPSPQSEIPPKPSEQEEPPQEEEPPDEEPKGEKEEKELTEPKVSSEGLFRYTVTLPADAFTLFNMAKAAGLERDDNKSFDVWLWDCVRKRFETDYKRRIILAGIGEE